jgi:hypothetical protein
MFYDICPSNQKYITFTDVIYKCLKKAIVFVPGKSFQPCLMYLGKARSLT